MTRKRILAIVLAIALFSLVSACNTTETIPEEPDSSVFFNAVESGKYYIKIAPDTLDPNYNPTIETAVDDENMVRIDNYREGLSDCTLLLGDKLYRYLYDNEIKTGNYYELSTEDRTERFNALSISFVSIFRAHPIGSGTTNIENAAEPDNTEFYYEEYYATVGELRDTWPFSDSSPNDSKQYLRVYFLGSKLYAFGLGDESEEDVFQVLRILEFSPEIPDRFTFEVPKDIEFELSEF